jgi:hypothetical protein
MAASLTCRNILAKLERGINMRTPKALNAIVDKVLRYRPKPKTTPARRRKRAAVKREKSK